MRLQMVLAVAIVVATACQSSGGESGQATGGADPVQATLSGDACPDVGDRAYFFWMEPRSAEPGDAIALHPYWTDMPGAYNDLPPGCLGDLSAHPEGAASFARQEDGLAIAVIDPEAEPGMTVVLEGTYGEHTLSGPVNVYRKADCPLVGTWKQKAETCPAESAVRELVFGPAGEFSVTWTPFEVYKDYWGIYEYDAASNAFRFAVEGGNQIPEDIETQGTAVFSDGELDISQAFFGTPNQASGPCAANFVRIGGG